MPDALLIAEELACERGGRLLFRGVALSLAAGGLLEIVGDNGSGKTSLLRVLAGLDPVYEGQLRYCGAALPAAHAALVRDVAYIGHRPGHSALLSARENLHWFCALRGADDAGAAAIDAALQLVGASGYAALPCAWLSAGQQRRVALARLPLAQARLWLLDEPFASLDAAGEETVRQLIAGQRAVGGAVVMATHRRLDPGGAALRLESFGDVAA